MCHTPRPLPSKNPKQSRFFSRKLYLLKPDLCACVVVHPGAQKVPQVRIPVADFSVCACSFSPWLPACNVVPSTRDPVNICALIKEICWRSYLLPPLHLWQDAQLHFSQEQELTWPEASSACSSSTYRISVIPGPRPCDPGRSCLALSGQWGWPCFFFCNQGQHGSLSLCTHIRPQP